MDSERRYLPSKLLDFTVYSLTVKFISAVKCGDVLKWSGAQMRASGKIKGSNCSGVDKNGKGRQMMREKGRVHTIPGLTNTHTCCLSPSLSLPFVSRSALSCYGHFTLTTGGLFVSLSGFAFLSGHLREWPPEWQNEYTLEHTLS